MIDIVMKLLSLFYFIVDVRLTTTNQVLLVMGVILWSVAFIVGIILSVIKLKTLVHRWEAYFLTVCIVVTIMLSLVLWVDCGISGWTSNQ